ncbi:MAG TPA: MgtC/SapB family protein [Candidatus Krumholzibacteria bacterium]|nr:MgtC/SapB family protein [Candidatus Krumholzibacteria bacterium]
MDATLVRFVIALLIGALIGIEREKTQRQSGEESATGLRTFILIAQAGAVAAWLSREAREPLLFAGVGLVCAAFILAGYRAHVRTAPRSFGLTTEFAALVAYLLGGVALFGDPRLAVALAIATSAVLAFRQVLHGAVERIGWGDIFAALKLLIVVFIVLPVVPRRPVDPWGVINPYPMTWLVILIAGLSLLGYVVARWLGPKRGTAVTGLAGGLVSSTAVTLSLSRRSQEADGPGVSATLASGILLSWAVMFVRVIVEAFVVNPTLAVRLVAPMGVMALVAVGGAAANHRAGVQVPSSAEFLRLKNPFSLSFAIKFALLFAAVAVLVNRAQELVSERAVYVVAALAGLTDVDAITLSMAREADHASGSIAITAITIAVLANTLVKTGLVWWVGSRALSARVLPTAIVVAAGAAISLLFVAR